MPTMGLAIRGGKLLREGGKVNIADKSAGCSACCETGVCAECEHCSGCDEENSPGCPTPACCTPNRISAVISDVESFDGVCINSADGLSRRVDGAPDPNRTVILVQTADPCVWRATVPNSGTVSVWLGAGCAGAPLATIPMSSPLIYELRRTATQWRWAAYINDVSGLSYIGSMPNCTGAASHTDPVSVAAEESNCKVIPEIAHPARAQCYEFFTPGISIQGSGGSTTFEACP